VNIGVRTVSATVHVGDDVTVPDERLVTDGIVVESVNVADATGKCSEKAASQSTYRTTTQRDHRRRGGHVVWEVDEQSSLEHRDSSRAGQTHTTTGSTTTTTTTANYYFFFFFKTHHRRSQQFVLGGLTIETPKARGKGSNNGCWCLGGGGAVLIGVYHTLCGSQLHSFLCPHFKQDV